MYYRNKLLYPSSLLKPLHLINNIRFDYINSMCNLKGKKVLDIGCGIGLLANKCALHGAKVVALDQSKCAIDLAVQNSTLNNIKYINLNLSEFYSAEVYDVIICMEVLEHLKDIKVLINILKNCINSSTVFFISSLKKDFFVYVKYILFGEYVLGSLKKNTHLYDNFYNILTINSELYNHRIFLNDIKFIKYNHLFNYSSLSFKIGSNYILSFGEAS